MHLEQYLELVVHVVVAGVLEFIEVVVLDLVQASWLRLELMLEGPEAIEVGLLADTQCHMH